MSAPPQATSQPAGAARVPELDGMRSIAVMLVMVFHGASEHFAGGWLGVDVFFVLSGFLITSLLLAEHDKTGRISLRAFYVRRALRLLPALFLMLAVYTAVLLASGRAPPDLGLRILTVVFYVANWARGLEWPVSFKGLGHTWSLSIEEQFYVLWPLALIALLRLRRRHLVPVVAGLIVAIVAWRAWLFWSTGSIRRCYFGLDTHADGLLVGCLVALRLARGRVGFPRAATAALAAGLAVFGLLAWRSSHEDPRYYLGGLTLVVAYIGLGLVWILENRGSWVCRLLRLRPAVWAGQISYGLYLWHYPIMRANLWPEAWQTRYRLLASILLTFAVAAISYHALEKPMLSLKRRFASPAPLPVARLGPPQR